MCTVRFDDNWWGRIKHRIGKLQYFRNGFVENRRQFLWFCAQSHVGAEKRLTHLWTYGKFLSMEYAKGMLNA